MTHQAKYRQMTSQALAREHEQSLVRFARAWGLAGAVGGGFTATGATKTQEEDQENALLRYGAKSSDRQEMTELLANLDKLIELLI